eukprot:g3570.t1
MTSIATNPTPSEANAPIVLPDTADESYKGTFVTDVYSVISTVKQPDFLHFSEGVYRVLQQVHPGLGIDLGAMYIMEDFNRYLLCSILQQAARFASEKRCPSLVDYVQAPNKSQSNNFAILAQDGARYLVYHDSEDGLYDSEYGWESKHVVQQYFEAQLALWETKDPTEKKNGFDKFLKKMREVESDKFAYPGNISDRDIQMAVRLCLPGEVAKHAVSEGTKSVTKFSIACGGIQSRSSYIQSRSSCAGLQFDVDQIGALMTQATSMVVTQKAACYLSAVMEYMSAEVLELSGNAARDLRSGWVTPRHIIFGVRGDEELDMFVGKCTVMPGGVIPHIHKSLIPQSSHMFDMKEDDEEDEDLEWVGTDSFIRVPYHGDNFERITKHHIKRLAARGGCVKVSRLIYKKVRGVSRVFLESIIRDAVCNINMERSKIIAPRHILSACARQGFMLWGTGRLPLPTKIIHPCQRKGPDLENPDSQRGGFLHEFSVRRAAEAAKRAEEFGELFPCSTLTYAKYSRCDFNGSIEEHEKKLAEALVAAKNLAKEKALQEEEYAKEEAEKERAQEEEAKLKEGYTSPTDKEKKIRRLHSQSLELVRKMQRSTERVIPFLPMSEMCAEIEWVKSDTTD